MNRTSCICNNELVMGRYEDVFRSESRDLNAKHAARNGDEFQKLSRGLVFIGKKHVAA